jgi:site-specific recombinase XerD
LNQVSGTPQTIITRHNSDTFFLQLIRKKEERIPVVGTIQGHRKWPASQKIFTRKVARHTNAQFWISYGAESAVLSKMLGHTKQETTRNYYNVDLPKIFEGHQAGGF